MCILSMGLHATQFLAENSRLGNLDKEYISLGASQKTTIETDGA